MRLLCPGAAVVRTSLIIGGGRSEHERLVHALIGGKRDGVLFTDDVRCPVHVRDLAAALWELTRSDAAGLFHLAGPTLSVATSSAYGSPGATDSTRPGCGPDAGRTRAGRDRSTWVWTAGSRSGG